MRRVLIWPWRPLIGDQLLQLAVLLLELLQPAHLGRQQTVLLLPIDLGRLADPGFAADLRHRTPVAALLQDERLLRPKTSRPSRRRSSHPRIRQCKL